MGIQVATCTFGLSSDYPTGGEDVDAILDLVGVLPNWDIVDIKCRPVTGYYFGFDRTNKKLMVFDAASGAEVAAHTDLKAFTAVQATIWMK